jgi:hypothetical protein
MRDPRIRIKIRVWVRRKNWETTETAEETKLAKLMKEIQVHLTSTECDEEYENEDQDDSDNVSI